MEAPKRSGALITAQFALDQGRDLFAAAVGVSSPLGEGTKKLAEDGARVIVRAAEIFEEWGMAYPEDTSNATGTDLALSLGRSLNIVCEE